MKVLVQNKSFLFAGADDIMVKTRNSRLQYEMCEGFDCPLSQSAISAGVQVGVSLRAWTFQALVCDVSTAGCFQGRER